MLNKYFKCVTEYIVNGFCAICNVEYSQWRIFVKGSCILKERAHHGHQVMRRL